MLIPLSLLPISRGWRLVAATLLLSGCSATQQRLVSDVQPASVAAEEPLVAVLQRVAQTPLLALRSAALIAPLPAAIQESRVVLIGEQHDAYAHHLVQRAVIEQLHQQQPNLTIGLEMFQTPFQPWLDQYIAGQIDEAELLAATEYYQRWRYDYRLYRPILAFAREQSIPLLALNVPAELTRQVAGGGFDAVKAPQQKWLPTPLPTASAAYRQRLRPIFDQHPVGKERSFEHFIAAQLLWDEGMAATAADYLQRYPERRLVVIAGNGHLAGTETLPDRLRQRSGATLQVILNDPEPPLTTDQADYLLQPAVVELPPRGRLGILMEPTDQGVIVSELIDNSAAAAAGVKQGDRLLTIAGRTIHSPDDVQIALLDTPPGRELQLEVMRTTLFGGQRQHALRVRLGGAEW